VKGNKMVILPTMNSEIVADEICEFIRDTVKKQNKTGAIVGLSGGIDSAVVTLLTLKAFKKTDYNLQTYIIPSYTSESTEGIRASLLTKTYKIYNRVIHIEELVDTTEQCFNKQLNPFDKGNMTSRIRANILSTYAALENRVLLGTGNQDEDYGIGYYTLFGDGAVHCSPIGGLSKRLVYQMGGYLNVPNEIVAAVPTAGLEHGQTDYGDLGYGYDIVEFFLEAKHQLVSLKDAVKEATERKFKYDVNKFPNIAIVWNDIIARHNIAQEKMKIIHPPSPIITLNYEGDL
jgi:NAD+ synthase